MLCDCYHILVGLIQKPAHWEIEIFFGSNNSRRINEEALYTLCSTNQS